MARNLQNEIDPDLEEVFTRSRTEWLYYGDIHDILAKREDLTTSTEPVQFPEEGLFLFDIAEQPVLDTMDWELTKYKVLRGEYDIRYNIDQSLLVPMDVGVNSTYERRSYRCESRYGTYRVAHYRSYHMSDSDSEEIDTGDDTEDSQNLGENLGEISDDDEDDDEDDEDDEGDDSGGDDNIEVVGGAPPLANGSC